MLRSAPAAVDQSAVRRLNSALLLRTLRAEGSLSRAQLARRLDLTRSTVSSIVQDLAAAGLVREVRLESGRSGRPGMLLELNPDGGRLLGVDLNIDLLGVVVTDFVGRTVWSSQVEVSPAESQAAVLGRGEGLIQEALAAAGGHRVLGIGVAVAGLVDPGAGVILYAPHLGWRDVAIGPAWRTRFGVPVTVENEAGAAALGEHHFGCTRGLSDFVFVSLGVGLAAGVFVNGRLLRGCHGFAGQVGHTVRLPGGDVCLCGRRGCWVTQVGLPAISRRLAASKGKGRRKELAAATGGASGNGRSHLTIQSLAETAAAGNRPVLDTLHETGRLLGEGIADLVNTFDPEAVVLGGPLSPLLRYMLPTVQQTSGASRLAGARQATRIMASAAGSWAPAVGATAAVFDAVIRDPLPGRGGVTDARGALGATVAEAVGRGPAGSGGPDRNGKG